MDTNEFINFGFDSYDLSLTTYFGDIYMPWRTVILLGLIFAALRVRKVIKARRTGK
jgi:hypothetical protein